jgi:dipeptidyl aminopeptidase/acylaminoacyl peptidase
MVQQLPSRHATPLIPRELLFGNPERTDPKLSPDGTAMSWLAPDARGVRQVWVGTLGAEDGRCVTADRSRGISLYGWTWDSKKIVYIQDSDGDENYHMFAVDLESGNVRDLTPWQGITAAFVASSRKHPDHLLVALNVRDRAKHDVWRINIETGDARLDTENPGDVGGWIADDEMVVRAATAISRQGAYEVRVRDHANAPWRTVARPGAEDEIYAIGFDKEGGELRLKSSIGNNTVRLIAKDLQSGVEREVASSEGLDAETVMVHPISHRIEAVAFEPGRRRWQVIDPALAEDFAAISKIANGDFSISSRDADDDNWIVEFYGDRMPPRFFLWDRRKRTASMLFTAQPKLDAFQFSTIAPVLYTARDGMKLNAYLTIPSEGAGGALPMVLAVHGGPWARDYWGFNAFVQFLANRGYAVLQPNYRGSTGYGKKYLHAGDLQWGLAMQDDLTDAMKWAIAEGIADPKRVAIVGASYGGYAALAGATFTPDLYCCAVDLVGPSSLFTLLASFPPYWLPTIGLFKSRMGDPDNPKHKEMLRKASPLFSADRIQIPMLIAQGANDPRVTQIESEQIVAAIEKNNGLVTYVLYPDEGHGFVRPPNSLDFTARMEKFLAEHLGGRYEPMERERIEGSTAVVRVVGQTAR